MKRRLETEAAEALLDMGVSLPFFRLPFTRRPVRLVMRRPCLGSLIRLARLYLGLGVDYEGLRRLSKDEELELLARHGRRLSLMVALTVCRGPWSGALLARPLAWLIRWWMPHAWLLAACRTFVGLLGTRPFMPFIASVERANPMTPSVSRERKGS